MFNSHSNNGLAYFLGGASNGQAPFNEYGGRHLNPAALYVGTVGIYLIVQTVLDVIFWTNGNPLWPTIFAVGFLGLFSIAYFYVGIIKRRIVEFAFTDRERRAIHVLMCLTIACFAIIQIIYLCTVEQMWFFTPLILLSVIVGAALVLVLMIGLIEYFRRHNNQYITIP